MRPESTYPRWGNSQEPVPAMGFTFSDHRQPGSKIALAPFDGPEVDAALARALEDRDWQGRQAAEDLSG